MGQMHIELDRMLVRVSETVEAANEMPKWKTALMAARISIVTKLLVYSFHALGLTPPEDSILEIRASIIADRADVCNRQLKAAFMRALDTKMENDLRTPITYGDITRAARVMAENSGHAVAGKWKYALPEISDGELWDDEVKRFALDFAKNELMQLTRAKGIEFNG